MKIADREKRQMKIFLAFLIPSYIIGLVLGCVIRAVWP